MERNGGAAEIELTGSDLLVMDESKRSEVTGSITLEELALESVEETADITIPITEVEEDADEELSQAELIPLDEYRAKRALRAVGRPLPPDEELTRPHTPTREQRPAPSTPAPRAALPPPPSFVPARLPPPSMPPRALPPPSVAPRALTPRPSAPPPRALTPPPSIPPLALPPVPRAPMPTPSFPPPPALALPVPIPRPSFEPPPRAPTPIPPAPRASIRIPIPERPAPELELPVTAATTALDALGHWSRKIPRSRELWTFVLGLAVLATLAAAVALVIDALRSPEPARATLGSAVVVTVAGPSGTAIPNAVVFADGRPWCDSAPCRLEGLEAGVHLVHVTAPGFVRAAQRAVSVGGSEDRTLHFELVPEATPAAATAPATVRVDDLPPAAADPAPPSAAPSEPARRSPAPVATPARPGVLNLGSTPRASVVVDGRPLGMTPQRVRVSAGPHSVLFVHPELGRAARSVNVVPGGNHTVAVQLGE